MAAERRTLVHWFRKGLRVHDNPALMQIFNKARASPDKFYVRPIFVLDPGILDWMQVGANRWRFLQQILVDLDQNLKELNSRLFVIRGKPVDIFPNLFDRWHVELLTYETDIEPYAVKRDVAVQNIAAAHGVTVDTHCSHTIYNPEVVIAKNLGRAPVTYQKFLSVVEKLKLPKVLDKPERLPKGTQPIADEFEAAEPDVYDCPTLDQLVKRPQELGINKFPGGKQSRGKIHLIYYILVIFNYT